MLHKISVGLVLLSIFATNEALRVLVCFPMTSKSHSILGHGVVNRLLEAGHEVVHITSFPRDKPGPKLKELDVSSIVDEFKDLNNDVFKLKNMISQGDVGDSLLLTYYVYVVHRNFLTEPNVVKFLSDPNEKFDAVILEWFFTEMTAGIPALFECPMIWVASTEPHWQVLQLIDEVPNPAYAIDLFSSNRPPLSFWQRVVGLWNIVKKSVISNLLVYHFEKRVYNNVFSDIAAKRGVTLPSYEEAIYNGSLLFINSHPSVGGSLKLPQNAINIAGYHINDKVKPLPKDLQRLMDEAKDGVIYFSLGSNVRSDGMSDDMKKSILNMFSKYKETIIWKFESDLTDIPPNVHLVKWAPQPSILAHPNLKLFITHGGKLSTIEAIHYGVPLVGIPVMADQNINMETVEEKGFGIKVTLAEDMVPELDTAVRKLLADNSYNTKAKELSTIFHHREMPPGRALAHWVEHVVQTRGAPHLRSPALGVPLYQRLYLDLAALLILVTIILAKVVKFVLKKRSNTKKSKKEKRS